jgi:hypothetical protein
MGFEHTLPVDNILKLLCCTVKEELWELLASIAIIDGRTIADPVIGLFEIHAVHGAKAFFNSVL